MNDHIPYENEDARTQRYGIRTDAGPFGRPDAEEPQQGPEDDSFRPWEEEPRFTQGEKLSAMMGALSAALLIGAVYAVGIGIVLLLMVNFWK